jgi:hypothetical protein
MFPVDLAYDDLHSSIRFAGKDAPFPTILSAEKAGVEIDRAATTAITISLVLIQI